MRQILALLALFFPLHAADPFASSRLEGDSVSGFLQGMPDVLSVWIVVRHVHGDGHVIRDEVSHEHMPLREWVRIHGPIQKRDVDAWFSSNNRPERRCVVLRYIVDDDVV